MDNIYNFLKETDPEVYVVASNDTIPVGCLSRWDSGTKTAKLLGAVTNGKTFIGVSQGAYPVTSNIDNVTGLVPSILIKQTGLFNFKTTPSESYVHALPVVMGADEQTIRLAIIGGQTPDSADDYIGYVWLPSGVTITGATGVTCPIKIRQNVPDPKLAS